MWQDYILGAGGFIFSIVLIPTIRGKQKPALSSSLLTALVLVAYVICMATLHLWIAFGANMLSCTAWLVLAWQRWKQNRCGG